MSDNQETRETVKSTGDSIYKIIEELTKTAFNSKEVVEVISSKSNEKLSNTMNQIMVSSFELQNAILTSEGVDPVSIISIEQNHTEVLRKISEKAVNDLVKKIPEYYTKLLDLKIEETYNISLQDLLTNPQKTISDFTKESLNDLLKKAENKYLAISIEDFKINVKKTKTAINIAARISLKPLNPYVQVLFEANGIKKQLCKLTFQTDGTINFSEIMIVAQKKELEVNLGRLDAKFRVSLKDLEVIDKKIISLQDGNDVSHELITVEVKKEFPKYIL